MPSHKHPLSPPTYTPLSYYLPKRTPSWTSRPPSPSSDTSVNWYPDPDSSTDPNFTDLSTSTSSSSSSSSEEYDPLTPYLHPQPSTSPSYAFYKTRDRLSKFTPLLGLLSTLIAFNSYFFPLTIPLFIGLAITLTAWVGVNLSFWVSSLVLGYRGDRGAWGPWRKWGLVLGTGLVVFWLNLGFRGADQGLGVDLDLSKSIGGGVGKDKGIGGLGITLGGMGVGGLGLGVGLGMGWDGLGDVAIGGGKGVKGGVRRHESVGEGVEQKWFIAANLYDNEEVFPGWSEQLLKLCQYLGEQNTFISIYESNSHDATPSLLQNFRTILTSRSIPHRIISSSPITPFSALSSSSSSRWWPYITAPERIDFLASARNKAMEPLQSEDAGVRLKDWQSFTSVVFLNDVWFEWEGIVRLLNTRFGGKVDYDLACALDFGTSGFYDTWVARDTCGTPLRAFWPYVKDKPTIKLVEREEVFPVASCWNGVVAFPAGDYLWREPVKEEEVGLRKRGWKMVDNSTFPASRFSPPISLPQKFRSSQIEACDHSEGFLFSYDLHRRHPTKERPPRIYVNPKVKVAYAENWFRWHNGVLRVPIIKWWLGPSAFSIRRSNQADAIFRLENWSRGVPFWMVDWIWEAFARRRRDYCTWAGFNLPDRCPALPGVLDRPWSADSA